MVMVGGHYLVEFFISWHNGIYNLFLKFLIATTIKARVVTVAHANTPNKEQEKKLNYTKCNTSKISLLSFSFVDSTCILTISNRDLKGRLVLLKSFFFLTIG